MCVLLLLLQWLVGKPYQGSNFSAFQRVHVVFRKHTWVRFWDKNIQDSVQHSKLNPKAFQSGPLSFQPCLQQSFTLLVFLESETQIPTKKEERKWNKKQQIGRANNKPDQLGPMHATHVSIGVASCRIFHVRTLVSSISLHYFWEIITCLACYCLRSCFSKTKNFYFFGVVHAGNYFNNTLMQSPEY